MNQYRIGMLTSALGLGLTLVGFGCGGGSTPLPVGDGGVDGSTLPDGSTVADGGNACGSLTSCAGDCVDTRFDPRNCGSCGGACATGEVCNDGTCAGGCGVGTVQCGDRCVDTAVDGTHCGSCDNVCADGEVCRTGACALSCAGGTRECTGSCVDLLANRSNCGSCGNACASGEACFDGSCGMRPTVDDDGDTVSNFDEQSSIPRDTDGDTTPDYLDDDSDGDGISDADEAGDTNVSTPPVDSDGDGTPDFQDLDSDNDSISDADEVTLGTDPTLFDTDGDGESDGQEVAAGSDPLDPTSSVAGMGGFAFDLPFGGTPRTNTLTFSPSIQKADVFFLVDTTGSMGGTINGLQTSLAGLVTSIRGTIPDTAFGVGRHDDFPTAFYGSASCSGEADYPFQLEARITTDDAAATAGVNALDMLLHCGADGPESQIESLFQTATGDGFRAPAGSAWVTPFDPDAGFDASLGHGRIGGAGFRRDALPIIILATDITFHHKWGDDTRTADRATWCGRTMAASCDLYSATNFGAAADQQPKTVQETLDALNGIGAKVFGLAVDNGAATSDQRSELSAFAVRTGAYIDPDASGNCATGVSGATRPAESWDPDGSGPLAARNVCPLVFSTNSTGGGVGSGIVTAIENLTSFVSFSTIHLEARDNPLTAGMDESQFFVRGIPVAATPPAGCALPTVTDRLPAGGDGTFDSFESVCPGTSVTFQVVMQNGIVMPTCTDQIFSMRVVVIGDDIVETDSRGVAVRVPGDISLCP